MNLLIWIGIAFCISQSAMFSGMNLAVFSISRLRLEVEAKAGNRHAHRLLEMRKDSNFLLTTILWGNVGINVLLTLLSDSVMAGLLAFLFSTCVITFAGEIIPQAYFSRHALQMASLLGPVLRIYQMLLYPVAKPAAWMLDKWLGAEGIHYFREQDLREVIKLHMHAEETDLSAVEGTGVLNFLDIDDLPAAQEGVPIDPQSILPLPFSDKGVPQFPQMAGGIDDPFIQQVERSRKKWVILTDPEGAPKLVLDADGFIRHTLFQDTIPPLRQYCHRPIIVSDSNMKMGEIIQQFIVRVEKPGDDVIDQDTILVWSDQKRIITGADILGRLMRGISRVQARA